MFLIFIIARAMAFEPGLRAPDGRPLSERSERGERIAQGTGYPPYCGCATLRLAGETPLPLRTLFIRGMEQLCDGRGYF